MATIRWFNSINGFSVGDELTEVIDTSGNVFTSKITSYIDVDIVSDNGNKVWNFDSTGNVVFPDTTTQTTAYPGTSTSLSLTGNISSGNANLGNLVTANFFHGVFDSTSSSQPNITSVGTLGNLSVTSNISAGNVLTDHLLYANGAAWDIGGVPAGSNTQIQFNNDNEFGATANLTFNSVTNTLTTANISAANGIFSGNSINGKNALQAGVTGFTAVPNTIVQFTSNLNSASQINFQNINTGATSSTDIALTSDNGNSVNNYINMGITGSAWDGTQTNSLGNALTPDDGYLYVRGGNLVIGTSKIPSAVKFIVGGSGTANIVATINRTNVDVTGDIIASGNASITGNISSTAGLLTLSTGTVAVSGGDAGIFTTAIGNINFGLIANISMGSTTGNVTARGNLIVNDTATITNLKVSDIYSNRTPIAVTTNTVIDSFPVIKYRSAKYTMRVNSDDGYQAVEVLLIHDSANSYVTIYGSLSTVGFDIIALSTNVISGNVRLLATTGSANTTVNLLGVYVAD
jgi:hypothetical protein